MATDQVVGVHLNAATVGFIPSHTPGRDEAATVTEVESQRLARLRPFRP